MYRIYTEDKNRGRIMAIVGERFDGFTVIPAVGVWKGKREQSLVIEIDAPDAERWKVRAAAEQIKIENEQEAVLVAHQPEIETALV